VSDLDIMEEMQKTGSQRYKPFGSNTQAQTRVATLDGTCRPVQRASRTAEQPLRVRKTIEYAEPTTRISRPTQQKPRTTHAYQQPRQGADTDSDVEVAPSVRMRSGERNAFPTRELPLLRGEQDQDARYHWSVFVGIGMILILLVWMIAVPIWSTLTVNIGSRWGHGPDHVTVLHGVFGHNKDSQAHPTRLEAFVEHGHVEVEEIAAGDPAHAHIYLGPNLPLIAGWQGDPSGVVIDMQISPPTHDNGKQDVLLDVRGPSFSWSFQPQELKLVLVNTGESFKLEGGH